MSGSEAHALLSEPDFADSHEDLTATEILTKQLDALINKPQQQRPLMNAPRVNLLEGLRMPALNAFDQGDDLTGDSPVAGDEALSEGEALPTPEATHVGRYLPPLEAIYGHHHDDGDDSDGSTSSSSSHSTFGREESDEDADQSQVYMQALMEQAVRTGDTDYTFDGLKGFISKGIDKLKKPLRSKEEKKNDKEVKLNAAAAAARTRAEHAVAKAKKAASAADALKTRPTKMDALATETFDATKGRREALRMKAIQDAHEKPSAAGEWKSPLNWTEARFAALVIDAVARTPGESLAQLEGTFAERNGRHESQDHYLGALASAVTFGAIRSAIEHYHGIDGSALKALTDQHDAFASQVPPMDPAKIALFADAASEYSNMVRNDIEKKTQVHAEQEKLAVNTGTRFASAIMEQMEKKFNPTGNGGAWVQPLSASHPSVALTSATQRLSSLYLKHAVDQDFSAAKHASFWSQPMAPGSWTATTVAHFA